MSHLDVISRRRNVVEPCGASSPLQNYYAKNAVGLEDTNHGPEDQISRSNTPSMTRGSSRSTASSVVACDHCGNPCENSLCHSMSDSESIRYQLSDMESGISANTTPEISQVGFTIKNSKDRPRLPISLAGERSYCRAPPHTDSKALSVANPMICQHPLTKRIENDQRDQGQESSTRSGEACSSTVPNPLHSIATRVTSEKAYKGTIEGCISDSDDSDNDTEDEDDGEDDRDWSGQDDNLEVRILQALDYNLPLAAHLIPILHKVLYSGFISSVTQKVGGWRQTVTKGNPADGDSGSQKSPSSRAPTNSSNPDPRKRQRNLDSTRDSKEADEDRDEDDDEDDRRPKRLKDEPESPGHSFYPLLACPFHKKDPQKYCVQHDVVDNPKKSVYRTCAGPGFKNIQRLMEHLRRKHNPVQCDRCSAIFDGPNQIDCMVELKKHRQLPVPCELNPFGIKEGISDDQWAMIEKKRGKKSTQGLSSIDKWNDIWSILFPDVLHPQTPWYDQHLNELPQRSPSEECGHFLEIYRGILNHRTNQQDIHFEFNMQERVINAAKQAFTVWSNTRSSSEANSSSHSSSARIYSQPSLLSGSYQVVHPPKIHGRNRFSESSAVQSDAYSGVFSHGSTEGPRIPRIHRNPSETSGHALPSSFASMRPPSYRGYNSNSMVSGAFQDPPASVGFLVDHLSNQYPMDMTLPDDQMPMAYEEDNTFNTFTPNATLGDANFSHSATGTSPFMQ